MAVKLVREVAEEGTEISCRSDPKYECENDMAGSQVNKVFRSHTHPFRVNFDLEIH